MAPNNLTIFCTCTQTYKSLTIEYIRAQGELDRTRMISPISNGTRDDNLTYRINSISESTP